MNDINKLAILKIAIAIIVALTGILTIVFSILNLANVKTIQSNAILIILVGIILLISGTAFGIYSLFDNNGKLINLIFCAIFLGFGIFCFTNESSKLLDIVVTFVFPIIVACFGGFMLIKTIINMVRKTGHFNILKLLLGAGLLVAGILFAHFQTSVGNVIWLMLGIGITISGVCQIVVAIKDKPRVIK